MADKAVQRTPTLETEWEDLTDRHRERRERVEQSIERFPEPGTQASYVIGAIGAGKTQLLNHLFKYSYREVGNPALFISMGELLDTVDERIGYPDETSNVSQEEFHDIVEAIAVDHLESVHEAVEAGEEFSRDLSLLDSGRITGPEEYASRLGITIDELSEYTTRADRITLIVDEMEESYNRLEEMIRSTTGPLREVVDRIESGNSKFYMVGGFGYASVHELGEAEYRRIDPVILPIIKPSNVQSVLGAETPIETRNFVWWMSRGRPGWLETAQQAFELHPGTVKGSYDTLGDIPNLSMSRVSIVSLEDLEEYCTDLNQQERDLTAYSIASPTPTEISAMGDTEWIEKLTELEAHVMLAEELTPQEDVVEAFLTGARAADNYDENQVSNQVIRRYLVRVLQSVTDEDDNLVFGAATTPMFRRGSQCHEQMLSPLAERVHDLALEEAGDENQETIDFLYELSQSIESADLEDVSSQFGDFFDLFVEDDDLTLSGYIGPSLGALVTTFPSLITNPRLSFAGTGRTETKQFEQLVDHLTSSEDGDQRLRELGTIIMGDDPT